MTVTESLVDAKDAAVEARLDSKIERAVADLKTHISEKLTSHTRSSGPLDRGATDGLD